MRFCVLLLSFLTLVFCADYEKKVVFGCKSGEYKAFEKTLDSMQHLIDYYERQKFKYDVVLVAQSECVKFMLSSLDDTEYKNEEIPLDIELKMSKLKSKARFEQCAVTLDRKQINYKKIKPNVAIIPSATISTVDYQLNGYAYLP